MKCIPLLLSYRRDIYILGVHSGHTGQGKENKLQSGSPHLPNNQSIRVCTSLAANFQEPFDYDWTAKTLLNPPFLQLNYNKVRVNKPTAKNKGLWFSERVRGSRRLCTSVTLTALFSPFSSILLYPSLSTPSLSLHSSFFSPASDSFTLSAVLRSILSPGPPLLGSLPSFFFAPRASTRQTRQSVTIVFYFSSASFRSLRLTSPG